MVASLLDLAPWAMPEAYQGGTVARFGQRLRSRLIKDARAVLVPSRATAAEARRLLRVRAARIRVVPLAARPAYRPEARRRRPPGARAARARRALRRLRGSLRRPPGPADAVRRARGAGRGAAARAASPTTCGRRACASSARRRATAPRCPGPPCGPGSRTPSPTRRACPTTGSPRSSPGRGSWSSPSAPRPRGSPRSTRWRPACRWWRARSARCPRSSGRPACSWSPGDPARLATAIRAVWSDDDLHAALVAATRERADGARTWADVARETRAVWAEVARPAPML